MKSGYESLIWIKDKNGKEYACFIEDIKNGLKDDGELTEDEKKQCLDVSQLVGTERW